MQPQPPALQPYLKPSSALDRKTMGKYDVLCRLAAGGMAEIFLAYQRGLAGFRKIVVLKSILPDVRGEEELVRMFLAEAQVTAQFNHPHIAQVFDLDIDGDVLFLAMEFVQGCTLIELARALDKAKESMPIGFTLRTVRDVALALHYAHTFTDERGRKQPVIHRDVAEKNIMVTHEGITKLLDFGIAKSGGRKMTMVGTVKGSTGYMSPEQIRGETVDTRSDVFSLGVVLHECLTGYRLFRGRTHEESMLKALEGDVMPPSLNNAGVSRELDALVLKALERERDHRYSTALELAREIERVAGPLWSQEQCGELVSRHFGDRKREVRELVLAMSGDNSSETGISEIVAAIQAARGMPVPGAVGAPVAPPLPSPLPAPQTQPGLEQTTPAKISDVQRAIDREQERTEQMPALTRAPAPVIDFSISLESEETPSVTPVEHVTDVNSAHVPANPEVKTVVAPLPEPEPPPVSTEVVASLLQSTPPPPLAPPPRSGPIPSPVDPGGFPTDPVRPAPSPPSAAAGRRVMRSKPSSSRAPLYGLIALVWVAAVVAVLMVLQVGPFAKPLPKPLPSPVVVEPVAAPPPEPVEPEPVAVEPEPVAVEPSEPDAPAAAAAPSQPIKPWPHKKKKK